MTHTFPRVFLAPILFPASGAWIDAADLAGMDGDDVRAFVCEAAPELAGAEWEEIGISDAEDFAGADPSDVVRLGIAGAAELAERIDELNGDAGAYVAWLGTDWHYRTSPLASVDAFRDAFRGEWRDLADFAEDVSEGCGDIPDHVRPYVDWDRMAEDFRLGGDFVYVGTGCGTWYVFDNRG